MARGKRKPKAPAAKRSSEGEKKSVVGLRIIGGKHRGRRLHYTGDARTRPMKDRLREAIFNLVGPSIRGKHAVDLFAGTGALGLEALSRGAARATLIEIHHPTADVIRQNVADLGLQDQTEVVAANVFLWQKREMGDFTDSAWAVFCSPPYSFYHTRAAEMLELINGLIRSAPDESLFVVEADGEFDFRLLPEPEKWNVRNYAPAKVGILRKP